MERLVRCFYCGNTENAIDHYELYISVVISPSFGNPTFEVKIYTIFRYLNSTLRNHPDDVCSIDLLRDFLTLQRTSFVLSI